jgi:ABC-type nitrate/sulfonate/bicarbonate transport system substrate-binding protein
MQVIYNISLLLAMLIGVLLPTRAETASATRLRIGYPSPSASFFPLFATKEAGLLEKYGFDSEMIYVQGVQLVQVHVAGQLDVATISSVVYLQAAVEGADLIQIASSIDGQLMKVMVHPSISKPQDLKGKTLAVTRFGSERRKADPDRQDAGHRHGDCAEIGGRRRHLVPDVGSGREDESSDPL